MKMCSRHEILERAVTMSSSENKARSWAREVACKQTYAKWENFLNIQTYLHENRFKFKQISQLLIQIDFWEF